MREIAIVDDERVVLKSLEIGLKKSGYGVRTFMRAEAFLEYLNQDEPDMILLDLLLPDGHGLEILKEIKRINRNIPTIIITAHGDIPSAVQAMKQGAFDYISKPFDIDVVEMLIAKACKERNLIREVEHHRNRSHQKTTLNDIIGESTAMQALFAKVRRLGRVDATTVLILGESGTGKDQLAKALHNQSNRRSQQFIEINCATLPEHLLESELFGHERGAFTDAKSSKVGLVELADGGTLFLDEVGEMPLALQAKLLKFLENRAFRRIGGIKEIKVDILIIASTNRDLEQCVAEKSFREDLYYRLAVVPLTMPPLRERSGDVDLLVSHYWKVFTHKYHKADLTLRGEVSRILNAYDWPGNIRELRNLLEQLVILSSRKGVFRDDLPHRLLEGGDATETESSATPAESIDPAEMIQRPLLEAVDALEIKAIRRALRESNGVKSKAAAALGISRYALLRRLKRYNEVL